MACVLVFCVAAVGSGAPQSKADEAKVHYNRGLELGKKGDLDGAIGELRQALTLDPDYPEAHSGLGHALALKGNVDAGIAECREALRLKPALPEAHNNLGNALVRKGDIGGAISEFREAIRLKPDYPLAHLNLGRALGRKGDGEGAIAEYREALRLKPDYPEAHYYLGNALGRKGDVDGAIAEYREAIRLKPDHPLAHSNLGYALWQKGDKDGAIAELREALRLKPDNPVAHNNLGYALQGKGDMDGAIAEYREALRLKPDYPLAHSNLGIAQQPQFDGQPIQQGQQNLKLLQRLQSQMEKARILQQATKPMTVDEERDLGREVSDRIVAGYHIYENDALTRYINEVGATVAAKSERQDIQYHFAVLDSDEIKFLSAPGGYVFVTRGTLMLCQDESELAGVLAHEVGHVSGKHVVHMVEHYRMQSVVIEATLPSTLGSANIQNLTQKMLLKNSPNGFAPDSPSLEDIAKSVVVMIFDSNYAAADEYDADARGVRYAHKAGYPADGLERFLVQLEKATTTGGAVTPITHTHPPVKERNDRIQQLIEKQQWQDADRPRLADRYKTSTAMLKTH